MRHTVSPSELPHLWAHQRQDWAKSGNMSFNLKRIFSYATCIGEFIREDLYAISVRSFSNSTAKHQSCVWQAIPQSATVVRLHCHHIGATHIWPDNKVEAAEELAYSIEQAEDHRRSANRARVDHSRSYHEDQLHEWLNNAAILKKEFKLRIKIDENTANRVKENTTRRLRQASKAKQLEDQKALEVWLAGAGHYFPKSFRDGPTRLRVYTATLGPVIQSSLGIHMELDECHRLYDILRAKRAKQEWEDKADYPIAGYAVNRITPDGVIAGCHRVSWDEIERIAKQLNWEN